MSKVFIIAEAGVNHNGKIELALKLCDLAKAAGVDAIKFQTWKTEKLLTKTAQMASYQVDNLGKVMSQFEMIKQLEISEEGFIEIKKHCDTIGLQFLSTPDEIDSLAFLLDLGIETIKVGSGEITNIPYLREIGSKKKDVILSTGMSNLGDVERAFNELKRSGAKSIALLHCTTNYPCPMEEVNLKAMLTLKDAFKVKVGYSDHTLGIEVPIAAVALGAEIIEKHFTLDKMMEGPDHKASLDPAELKQMVVSIRNIERALGSGIKCPNASELRIKTVVQKSVVAKRNISKGELFTSENLTTKRSDKGISALFWDEFIGKTSKQDYSEDDFIVL